MHREPKHFVACVKRQYPEFFAGKKVLEVGSLDINGGVREFFTDCDYTGIDLGVGKGVDQVSHVVDLGIQAGATSSDSWFDVIISTETLEHDSRWHGSLQAMYRLLKPNGLLVITCAAPNRPEHGTTRTGSAEASPFTSDYYCNISVEDFASVLPANLFSKSYLGYRGNMDDLYFAGIKPSPVTVSAIGVTDEFRGGKFARVDNSRAPAFDDIDATDEDREYYLRGEVRKRKLTVTCEISTRDRYTTTLPMCISAILMQTRKPEKLVIYDDGEQKDLRELPPFDGLLRLATDLGIEWTFFTTNREGQVKNHQHALDNCSTDVIFRIDDDCIPEPNCLENLLAEMKDGVGAVGGLIHHPGGVSPLPDFVDGSLDDVAKGLNISWYQWEGKPREVAHLYSSFVFRVDAARKAGGYCMNLSPVCHREETIFSHSIMRTGHKLICTPKAKIYHLRQNSGGIRSFSDTSLWQHDELIFQEYLRTVGQVNKEDTKLIVADMGLGDHLLLRAILIDEFSRKYPDRQWTVACCYPETMEDIPNVKIISIAEAKLVVGSRYEDYSLFAYLWRENWTGSIVDGMRKFYGQP